MRILLETPRNDLRQFRRTFLTQFGKSHRRVLEDGGNHLRVAPARKRSPPLIISWRIIPNEKRSLRLSGVCPRNCSGDLYRTVPTTIPGSVCTGDVGTLL